MASDEVQFADFAIGPGSIDAFSRLSYTMWYALAEFIDNSTQSRLNYTSLIDDVLKSEGRVLTVDIVHNRVNKTISINDNSIGMTKDDLIKALQIAKPTQDSKGRSKYGMGLKTAACWIGKKWEISTCEITSGEEWTAVIDVDQIAFHGAKIPLSKKIVSKDAHYTNITISELHRNIQKKTEETIKWYLSSMYRFDLSEKSLNLTYNTEPINSPDNYDFDTDPAGKIMKRVLPEKTINGKIVKGWVAVLKKGGRKYGGFSLFQEKRQIQGFPNAWKPKSIFGGVDEEGANNLVSQRLMGQIELDGFKVSHTKDAILFEGDEEDDLDKFLTEFTKDYRDFSIKRRGARGTPWQREKIKDLVDSMKSEFSSGEMKDAINHAVLPPLDTILKNNQQQVISVTEEEILATIDVLPDLKIIVSLQSKSEFEPYLTISASADINTIHVILNDLHPYYCNIESSDGVEECIRQYIYDAISEYKLTKVSAKINPNSIRRLKDTLLRAQVVKFENKATDLQAGSVDIQIPPQKSN